MVPFELDQSRRSDTVTIALNIGFEYEQPDIAMRVANELLPLILNEDARKRRGAPKRPRISWPARRSGSRPSLVLLMARSRIQAAL